MIFGGVQLGWEVIALRLALLVGQLGVLGILVHVMGDRPHVVEKLRVDGPSLVLIPDCLAYQPDAGFGHRIA